MSAPFARFIASSFCFFAAIGLSILVMIHGWGLEPKSWWWIIGAGIVVKLLIDLMRGIAEKDK